MSKTIKIYPVSVDEINDWLEAAIMEFDGHELNVVGTIAIMLDDFSGFIQHDPKNQKRFLEYVEMVEKQDEAIH